MKDHRLLNPKDLLIQLSAASDYDDWETTHENPGWGSKNLIPLAEKVRLLCILGSSSVTDTQSLFPARDFPGQYIRRDAR